MKILYLMPLLILMVPLAYAIDAPHSEWGQNESVGHEKLNIYTIPHISNDTRNEISLGELYTRLIFNTSTDTFQLLTNNNPVTWIDFMSSSGNLLLDGVGSQKESRYIRTLQQAIPASEVTVPVVFSAQDSEFLAVPAYVNYEESSRFVTANSISIENEAFVHENLQSIDDIEPRISDWEAKFVYGYGNEFSTNNVNGYGIITLDYDGYNLGGSTLTLDYLTGMKSSFSFRASDFLIDCRTDTSITGTFQQIYGRIAYSSMAEPTHVDVEIPDFCLDELKIFINSRSSVLDGTIGSSTGINDSRNIVTYIKNLQVERPAPWIDVKLQVTYDNPSSVEYIYKERYYPLDPEHEGEAVDASFAEFVFPTILDPDTGNSYESVEYALVFDSNTVATFAGELRAR